MGREVAPPVPQPLLTEWTGSVKPAAETTRPAWETLKRGRTYGASAFEACKRDLQSWTPLEKSSRSCQVKCVRTNRIGLTAVNRILIVFFPPHPFLKLFSQLGVMANGQQGGSLPSSQGGLVQYFDADSGIEIDPKTVIMLSGLLIAFELVMKSPLV